MKGSKLSAILAAVTDSLERRRAALEGESLNSVSVIVSLDRRTQSPFKVIVRTEGQDEVNVPANWRQAS